MDEVLRRLVRTSSDELTFVGRISVAKVPGAKGKLKLQVRCYVLRHRSY